MLSRKKKTHAWLKSSKNGIRLLARLSQVFNESHTLEESFEQVGTLLSEHLQIAASGLYVYNQAGEDFLFKGGGGTQEVFASHQKLSLKDLELCQLRPLQLGMLSLPDIDWQQVPVDCFLDAWKAQNIQSVVHLPLTAHGELYGLLLLVSTFLHRMSEADIELFTVLSRNISLATEGMLLLNQFEQDVAAKVAQLQESEGKYQAVFEDASEAIVLLDIATQRFLEVNRQAELLSGYTRTELLTMTVNDFWVSSSSINTQRHQDLSRGLQRSGSSVNTQHHQDLSRDLQRSKDERGLSPSLLRLAKTRKSVRLRDRQIRRKDGQRHWIALTASSVDYRGEKVILAIVRDVTQRKQLELERSVIETINQALISSHDVRNVYNIVAQNLRKVFAFDWMDILLPGNTSTTLRLFMSINVNNNISHLEEREYTYEGTTVQTIFQQGRPQIDEYQGDEPERSIPTLLGRQLQTSLFFPLDYQKQVIGVLHFGSSQEHSFSPQHFDFLRRIASQLAIAIENTVLFRKVNEERAVYKHLIENVNELVFQVDPRGKIVFTNHRVQHVLGLTPEETIDTNFFSYLIPEDLENARAAFRVAMRHEQPLSGEYRVIHKSGNILTISIYTLPIFENGRAVGMQGVIQDISPPSHQMISPRSGLHELIGRSARMQDIYELIMSVAETDSTILIHGESGTGKELIAQAIHAYSHRKHQPFIVVNCAAYSEHLLESELFGHDRGAFTGAHRRKLGRFELAKGGTIFLDEVGEIPLHSQLLLLRVLQNKTFERVGGEKTIDTDVRIVAATNRKLIEDMRSGRFREDLYYRLNVISIDVPPLRQRKDDIPYLVDHFLKKYATTMKKQVLKCSQSALELLMNYDWYGNVRELEHAIERAVVMASGAVITPDDLPTGLRQMEKPLEKDEEPVQAFTLYEHEKRYILQTLKSVKWNKYQAAKRLGITRSTLYSKIEKYQLKSGKG